LSSNEIEAARQVKLGEFNAQQQTKITWPSTPITARAYVDQLARSNALPAPRVGALKSALDRVDRIRSAQDRGTDKGSADLQALAAELERDAAAAHGRDAERMRALAATLREIGRN
jgi:hypothetical protein